MRKINYKSDFDFIMRLKDRGGREAGWPGYDWTAKFWASSKANTFVASRKGDALTNCFNDKGQIHIVCDNHRLGRGALQVEFHAELPDGLYPDGKRDTYEPQPLGIELVDGAGECATDIEAELTVPYAVRRYEKFAIDPVVKPGIISIFSQPGAVYERKSPANAEEGSAWIKLPVRANQQKRSFYLGKLFPDGLPEGWRVFVPEGGSWEWKEDSNELEVTLPEVVGKCDRTPYLGVKGAAYKSRYLMIGEDGSLRGFNNCCVPLRRVTPAAPTAKDLSRLMTGKPLPEDCDLELRRKYRSRNRVTKKHVTKWGKPLKIPRCGVIKMRRVFAGRRSGWRVFSFVSKGFFPSFIVELS